MADQVIAESRSQTVVDIGSLHAGDNPRLSMDEDVLKELTASIERDGILEPLRVTQNDNGFRIESGHRRWTAALALGIQEIPVVIVDQGDKADEFARALITNLQRENLNPVDEAMAYSRLMSMAGLTKSGVAERLGVKTQRVTIRLELLDLPTEIVELYQADDLPLGARSALKAIADIDQELAVEVAQAAAGKAEWAEVLIDDPIRVVAYVANVSSRVYFTAPNRMDGQAAFDLFPSKKKSTKAGKDLGDRIADATPNYMTLWLELTEEDADAAQAAGVFYRPDPEQKGIITDPQFVWELLPVLIDRREKQAEERAAEAARMEVRDKPSKALKEALESGDGEAVIAAEKAKQAKREEREAELAGRATAQALNEQLGSKLYAELKASTSGVPLELAQLVTAPLERDVVELVGSGLRYCLPQFWVDEVKKAGTKRSYADGDTLGAAAVQFIKVDSGDELLRRWEIVLACARFADQGAVALSNRIGAHNHGGHPQPLPSPLNGSGYSPASKTLKAFEARVKALVPAPLRGSVRPSEKPVNKLLADRKKAAGSEAPSEG